MEFWKDLAEETTRSLKEFKPLLPNNTKVVFRSFLVRDEDGEYGEMCYFLIVAEPDEQGRHRVIRGEYLTSSFGCASTMKSLFSGVGWPYRDQSFSQCDFFTVVNLHTPEEGYVPNRFNNPDWPFDEMPVFHVVLD